MRVSLLIRYAESTVVALVLMGVCSARSSDESENYGLPSEPLKGRIVFEQKHCNACHSISGAGGNIGPDLAEQSFSGTFLDLASSLWNHIPDMMVEQNALNLEWPRFTDDDVSALISYLYYLRYLGTPGDVSSGEKLFSTKGCLKCHTIGEKHGGDVGPELDRMKKYASPIYIIQAIWNHGPEMQEQFQEYGMERPTFVGQDISDLSAYIRSISQWTAQEQIYLSPGNPVDGRNVFGEKGCVRCHAVRGRGGGIGPALDDVELSKSVNDIAAMMWNHADEMQTAMGEEKLTWPTFEKKEMADLIAYLYFINFMDPPGDANRGLSLFAEKQCLSCHAVDSAVGGLRSDLASGEESPTSVSVLRAMFNHADKMSETVLSEGKPWPVLTGSEMRDICAYLEREHETGSD
ncbi:MAG: cytochrome c [Candidatus Latescibacterota bacterium]|nr:MAG: cytochrome c [Candidatus Latescibacterota bacterium]